MKFVSQSVTRSVARSIMKVKKNSPHIFFASGLVGVVGSTVLACRATLKLEPVLDEIKDDFKQVKELRKDPNSNVREYTDKQYYQDMGYLYGKSARKLTRLYGPSLVLGSLSVAALTGSHVQMTRRNTTLTATLAAVSQAYDGYRERVREELGVDKELEIHRGIREETIEEDGKKKVVKVSDPNHWSVYARIFDEYNPNWQKDSELNRLFVQCQQNYANHLLQSRGHVFLNEVYDALGMERSHAGAVVGWMLDGEHSDGYVDFGMFEAHSSRFINNIERSIILDFNVDGVIYDKF